MTINSYREIKKLKKIAQRISKVYKIKMKRIYLFASDFERHGGFVFHIGEGEGYIFINIFLPFKDKIKVLCHECAHLVLYKLGIKPNHKHGSLFNSIFQQIYGSVLE